jgi:hypothetical protein
VVEVEVVGTRPKAEWNRSWSRPFCLSAACGFYYVSADLARSLRRPELTGHARRTIVHQVFARSEPSFGEHAGRHTDLAQRRGADASPLGPRGSHLDERFLQLRQASALVDLSELSVDVEPLLDQLDLTDRRRLVGDPLLDLGTTLLKVGPAAGRPFGARSVVR